MVVVGSFIDGHVRLLELLANLCWPLAVLVARHVELLDLHSPTRDKAYLPHILKSQYVSIERACWCWEHREVEVKATWLLIGYVTNIRWQLQPYQSYRRAGH